jgi:FtsH-binding integral membrane protein
MFAPIAAVLFLSFRIDRMSFSTAQAVFWGYAALMGLSLAGILLIYTGTSVARVFFISAGTFAAMSAYGYSTKAAAANKCVSTPPKLPLKTKA